MGYQHINRDKVPIRQVRDSWGCPYGVTVSLSGRLPSRDSLPTQVDSATILEPDQFLATRRWKRTCSRSTWSESG